MAIDRWPLLAHSLVELVYLALGALFAWEVGAAAWVAVFSGPDACPSAGGFTDGSHTGASRLALTDAC